MAYCCNCGKKNELCECPKDRSRSADRRNRPDAGEGADVQLLKTLDVWAARFGIAKSEDLAQVRTQVTECQEDLRKLRVDTDERFNILEQRIEDSASSRHAGTAESSGAASARQSRGLTHHLFEDDDIFIPAEVKIQGFCDFKCPTDQQLPRDEAKRIGEEFMRALPTKFAHLVSFTPPREHNFRLLFGVVGGQDACEAVCNFFRNRILTQDVRILNRVPKASVELPPWRRRALSYWFAAKRRLQDSGIQADLFLENAKDISLSRKSDGHDIGKLERSSSSWQWDADTCRDMGISIEEELRTDL